MTAAAAPRCRRLLSVASVRANHVTPTMYTPTTPAVWRRSASGKASAGIADRPRSTFRNRHAAIATGPSGVRFSQAS
jgi:hypothetical protein